MTHAPRRESSGTPRRFRNGLLGQAWLVLVLALLFGTALAAVQTNLSAMIAANKLNETMARVPDLVGSGAGPAPAAADAMDINLGSVSVQKDGRKTVYPVFKVNRGSTLAGWVARAGGQGYADKIELLIGLDPGIETITGVFVLEQKETPGLGNKIVSPAWRDQFANRSAAEPLVIAQGAARLPSAIDAVSGATISSRSVTAIINRTISDLRGNLTPERFQASRRP